MLKVTTTNEDLLRQCKDWQQDEGWREFHRLYAPAILAHARYSGLTPEEAEDVVQTTMIKVATYLPTFEYDKTVCRFRTWLNQIVNQRILAVWHQRKRSRLPEAAWLYLCELVAGISNPVVDAEGEPDLEHRMLEVCLARVRADVKPRHWQIFEANTIQGMDSKSVAARFGTTSANVWVVRHRLIQRLKTEWKGLLKEPFGG